jgi:osmotically inducible lipoprotein OsmB
MQKIILTLVVLSAPLAGCVQSDVTRGLGGAVAGGLIASATRNDVATGMLVGGLAGTVCDDVGICRPRY